MERKEESGDLVSSLLLDIEDGEDGKIVKLKDREGWK